MRSISTLLFIITFLSLTGYCSGQSDPYIIRGECSPTEAWAPVGTGLPAPPQAAGVFDDRLYVASGYPMRTGYIASWDGSGWSIVTTFSGSWRIMSILKFNGEIYITGNLGAIDDLAGTETMARWDGRSWKSVGDPFGTGPRYIPDSVDVAEYNGELYTFGAIVAPSGTRETGIMAWNGTRWRTVASLTKGSTRSSWDTRTIYSMKVWRGSICLTGNFVEVDGKPIKDAAMWDGTEWRQLGMLPENEPTLITYGEDLYVLLRYTWPSGVRTSTVDRFLRWDGETWQPTGAFTGKDTGGATIRGASGLAIDLDHSILGQYRNELCGMFQIGAYGSMMIVAGYAWNGTSTRYIPRFNYWPNFLIEYHGELYAGGNFSSSCGTPLDYIAKLCGDPDCVPEITGSVYYDSDSNCIYHWRDSYLPGRTVELTPGPLYAVSDVDGIYRFHVPAGRYNLRLLPQLYWDEPCTADSVHVVDVAAAGGPVRDIDFASDLVKRANTLRVRLAASAARTGGYVRYTITYMNIGTEMTDGIVRFIPDDLVRGDSSRPVVDRHLGTALEWDFQYLLPGEARSIIVSMTVPAKVPEGTEICSRVEIEPHDAGDIDNWSDRLCTIVRNSIVQNQIEVTPGKGPLGEIEPKDSVLTYSIHFQNLGSVPALRVTVRDTLDPRLDPTTIELGAASHLYRFRMDGNGVATWTFDGIDVPWTIDGIYLPHAAMNEPASHGIVTYSIHLRPGQPIGTVITNRAGITFDYNEPVVTNTAVSTIVGPASVPTAEKGAFAINPNPARTELRVTGAPRERSVITLRDLLGKTIRAWRAEGEPSMTLDIGGVPAGAYLLEIATATGTMVERVTVVK